LRGKGNGAITYLMGTFSWNFQFQILQGGPFRIILGLDFLSHPKMAMDLAGREYYSRIAGNQPMKFENLSGNVRDGELGASSNFQQLAKDTSKIVALTSAFSEPYQLAEMLNEYSELCSGQLGTTNWSEYETELGDLVPVRSTPYHCAPIKLELLKEFVEDLLQKGVVQPSRYLTRARRFYYISPEEDIGW
jgi:hypothetical protein